MIVHVFQDFISKEALSGILLFLSTLFAVVIANSPLGQTYYDFWHMPLGISLGELSISMSLTHWINDALMALFFLMVGLEIKREMLVGELSTFQKASFPIVAAIGGMAIPALIYVILNPSNPIGFGIPMATDIAFVLGILLLLGSRVNPALKLFLVALAVVDDLGAVLVVATVYTKEIHFEYFLHIGVIYTIILLLNFKGVKSLTPYLILGIFLWGFFHATGIHATIAGVMLAFAIPLSSKIKEKDFIRRNKKAINQFEKNMDKNPILTRNQIDALENIGYGYEKVQNPLVRLEHNLHSFSAFFIIPVFAFANAGVIIDFSTLNENLMLVLGIVFGLILGKPLGIFGFTYLASKLSFIKKPENITWYEIFAAGFLGGIGFTMSIFISHLAFIDESLVDAAKLGVFIASFIATIIGITLILKTRRAIQISNQGH
jgi:NhaA family Na+:H+ antiporter